VLRSLHRGIGSSITATADVAVIEPKTGVSVPGAGLPIQSVAAKDQITLQVSRGSSTSWIRGLSPSFAVSPTDQP
jgi:pyruvate kinase